MLAADSPWNRVLALAWEAFLQGSTPIGAIVLDPSGAVVAEGRGRRLESDRLPNQLSGTRIAHAEVNALALLPPDGPYDGHALYASVEPCALCMGAVLQTGIGRVVYAWEDPYAGAARCMKVDNPQVRRRSLRIDGPDGGFARRLSALLCLVHYQQHRPALPHVTDVMEATDRELAALARTHVGGVLAAAERARVALPELCRELQRAAPQLFACE